jgi:hypothetical protein
MNHNSRRRLVVFCILTLAFVVSAFGQDYKPFLGKWSMTSESGGDPVTWTLVLKETDGKLLAVLASDQGEQPAKGTSFADGTLKFSAPYQGEDYDIELKLADGKLVGTWSGNGDSGKTSGTKL